MTTANTKRLYVNLSASQVRKRLKGHGFGVRRVEAADRNQAIIMHTATGRHLRELLAIFSDVVTADQPEDADMPVENLRNLGSTSAHWLQQVGIGTRADLVRVGPVVAFRLVQQHCCDAGVTLNLLWALAAALDDRDWRDLSNVEKSKLRKELEALS